MSGRQKFNLAGAIIGYFKPVDHKADIETYGGAMRIEVRASDKEPMFYLSTPFARGMHAHAMTRDDLLSLADLCVRLAAEPKGQRTE